MAADLRFAAGQAGRSRAHGCRQSAVRERGVVGAALRRALAATCRSATANGRRVHKRFTRWAKAGVWERVFACLDQRSRQPVSDARYHSGSRPPAGGGRKRGAQDQALGRSRGGLTTKIHTLADAQGRSAALHPDRRPGARRYHRAGTAGRTWRPSGVIADEAYDSNALREPDRRTPVLKPLFPPNPNRNSPHPARRSSPTDCAIASSASSTS